MRNRIGSTGGRKRLNWPSQDLATDFTTHRRDELEELRMCVASTSPPASALFVVASVMTAVMVESHIPLERNSPHRLQCILFYFVALQQVVQTRTC
jgi:hypothetical protein